ncbi:hypothetical protein FOZ63_016955, partial [Perkinsus olseni]
MMDQAPPTAEGLEKRRSQTSVGVEDAKLWAAELEKLRRGTACVFLNKFEEAEKIFRSGIFANSEYDMLPVPARACWTALPPLRTTSFDDCLSRVWLTEKLAAESPDQWILQQSFVKAGVNLTRSWTWIKSMEKEVLEYEGYEADVVKSL